jgi:hypothetical protein
LTEIVTTPTPVDPPAEPETAATPEAAPPAERRRRRWWVAAIAAGAVLVVLLVCGGIALVGAGFRHAVRSAEAHDRSNERVRAACVELERRLNRVAPPGAAPDAKARAAAIRAENAAVRPFLADLDASAADRGGDHDRDRRRRDDDRWPQGWAAQWQRLVDARTAYADGLDRAAPGGEPAFYLPPQTEQGHSVADRLKAGPDECAASARRLAAPDL